MVYCASDIHGELDMLPLISYSTLGKRWTEKRCFRN